ncbi:ABC transporter ATP-binding protein [Nocardioides limicola]|uniref:ABC transporter ATP-binding protein n=1 Tax=Nocardioides limicola TaxID=2803368 RepID=UPI00193B282A|nr:ABC transporter ATP-binding protein [Nocardioides sp. DJM-14]
MTNEVARLMGVTVTYQSAGAAIHALRDVDLRLSPGSSTSFMGRSGSGKSTLVSVLSLLRRPTTGTVFIDGHDVSLLPAKKIADLRASQIGIVFQAFHLEPGLTVTENVLLAWHFRPAGMGRRAARERVLGDLERVGIADLAGRRPHTLSGGQRQRVAIARALFSRPSLLVADEPTGNLDESNASAVGELLLSLPAELGTALVIVTHDRAIAGLAQTRMELSHGQIARRDSSYHAME